MSFNSRAFLADRERLLEPEPVRGSRRTSWHGTDWEQHATIVLPPPDRRTEEELEEIETEYLRKHGVI